MTLQWILVYRQPAQNTCCTQFRNRRHVASWGEGDAGRGDHILDLSHKRGGGGNFLKYPFPGRGKFSICLNCLKITDPLDSFVVWQNKSISSLLFFLLGLTQRGAAVTSTPITDARTWLLLLCDLFYPSSVEEGPIHLTNHRVSNAQNYSLRCEHFVVKSVEFVLIQAYRYPCTLYLKSFIKPPGSYFKCSWGDGWLPLNRDGGLNLREGGLI